MFIMNDSSCVNAIDSLIIYKNVKNKYIKRISIIALSILIVLIGASRIYLGVHYTSDVIAGFLIAIAYLILYTNLIKKFIFSYMPLYAPRIVSKGFICCLQCIYMP